MKTWELLLSREERALLASTIGSVWDHYGAQAALDDGHYALVDMYVQTESGALTIAACLETLNLEGSPDEYAHVQVRAGAAGSRVARQKGTIFLHDRGRTITDVLVVRDSVSSTDVGDEGFSLVADVGIVFVFGVEVVAICLGGPFASDLTIVRASSMQALELPDTSAQWGEDISYQLVFTRQLVRLGSEHQGQT